MIVDSQHELGPGVSLVIGDEALVDVGEADKVHDVIGHLKPHRPGRDIMVLHHPGPESDSVVAQADRLMWMNGRCGAPELIANGRSDDGAESVVIRVPAMAISAASPQQPVGPETLAQLLGESLRLIHSIPVDDCIFESMPEAWMSIASSNVAADSLDSAADGPYASEEPARLLEILNELLEASVSDRGQPVFIHGHATLGHTWLAPDGSVSFTGWQRAGLGDRHHDLAVAASSLTNAFGPAVVPPLLESYGFDQIDLRSLDMHQLLVYLAGAAR